MNNIMLMTDSYKQSHWKQYPANTQTVYSYFESRGGQWDKVVFFGLQYYLKRYLEGTVVTQEKIDEAEKVVNAHMGAGTFNRTGWEYILNTYQGRLPVKIKAVPEGSVIPGRNVLMTIENTDPNCYWLTNFLETMLVQVWYGCTVATQSREMKKMILRNLQETGDPELIDFKLHDFGYRGVSSIETAGVGGCAHLTNFLGTDTMAALEVAAQYYDCEMAGFSIPASEHSTMTSWGRDNEVLAMQNMLTAYPTGLVACVSDSFDIHAACRDLWGDKLRDMVLARDGTLVVRPDSGYPPKIVCDILEILYEKFGGEKNEKGYKVLDPHVRVIQGDGIDFNMLQSILTQMKYHGWSGDNIAFGSGGGLLQKLNRDTLKFAFKCSAIERIETPIQGVDLRNVWHDVYKDPATDPGKVSKKGRLKLVRRMGSHGAAYETVSRVDCPNCTDEDFHHDDELETVFLNGVLFKEHKLEDVRKRTEIHPWELQGIV